MGCLFFVKLKINEGSFYNARKSMLLNSKINNLPRFEFANGFKKQPFTVSPEISARKRMIILSNLCGSF